MSDFQKLKEKMEKVEQIIGRSESTTTTTTTTETTTTTTTTTVAPST